MTPDRRYRICRICGQRWNISGIGPNPHQYVCPHCAYKRAAAGAGTPTTASKNTTAPIMRPEGRNVK